MINLRVFSNFSLGESILKPQDIIRLAKEYKQWAVAIVDRMNMFGAMEFSIYGIKEKIKPILGCLLKIYDYGYIPVYIKNEDGYKEISNILTEFYKNKQEYITIEQLITLKNVIVFYGGEESKYSDENDLKMKLEFLKDLFCNNLYIEIQNTYYDNILLKYALSLQIPIVYTHNTFFENGKEEANYVFNCICSGKRYSKDELSNSNKKNNYFFNKEEIEIYSKYEEGLLNTESIAKRCNFFLKEKAPMIPEFVSFDQAGNCLRELVFENLKKKLIKIDNNIHKIYYERAEKELEVIISRGFSNYFLVTHDFVQKAKSMNVPVGHGRGSGTGSLVSYSLGITNVDPIKFNLIFERFLNPERISMPDLDIDFDQERRELILKYLREKYGDENIAHIITFGTMKSRIVVRDVGRALMIPLRQVDNICKFIPQDQVKPVTLKEAVSFDNKLMEMFQENDQTKKLLDISIQLEGLVRHTSLHAAGIVIYKAKDKLSHHVPLYRVDENDELCTQFSMKYVEMAGLVKFDFLGLQTLTLIRKTLEMIEKNHNIKLNSDDLPHNDTKTFKFINSLNLAGIFQLDSFGMKNVIFDLKPDSLEDIIAIISLFRPGPMKFIPQYTENKNDHNKIKYLHPILEPILKSTYGVIVYQEQVLEIAVKCAGYSLGDGDNLRRAMGKKIASEMEKQKGKFLKGAEEKGLTKEVAEELFNRISEFAGYGFNKSHAAPYGLISYITAYLKTHYAIEFMTALMILDKNDTNKLIVYINDMKKLNINVLPPSINKSEFNFSIEGNNIRFGLSAIKNVGESFAKAIVEEREKNGLYITVDNFIHRNINNINKRQLEFLIYSNAFGELGVDNIQLIKNLKNLMKGSAILETNNDTDLSIDNMEYWEMDALGFFLTNNPMDKEDLKLLNLTTINEVMMMNKDKGAIKMAGVVYDIVKKKTHYNNKTYMFITLFDVSGVFEVTLFSDTIEKYIHIIGEKKILVMDVVFEKKHNIVKITCNKLIDFESYKQNICTSLYIKVPAYKFTLLSSILNKYHFEDNYFNKVILQYKNKNYLLPYYLKVTKELLQNLKKNNINYVF